MGSETLQRGVCFAKLKYTSRFWSVVCTQEQWKGADHLWHPYMSYVQSWVASEAAPPSDGGFDAELDPLPFGEIWYLSQWLEGNEQRLSASNKACQTEEGFSLASLLVALQHYCLAFVNGVMVWTDIQGEFYLL